MPNKDNKTEEEKCCGECLSVNTFDHWCSFPDCPCHKGGGADEVKDTSLERYREEYRKRFHDGDGTIGDRKNNFSTEDIYSKIEDFLISKILEVRKATEQKVREEIVEDVCGILRQIGTVENDEQMENVMLVIKSLLKP